MLEQLSTPCKNIIFMKACFLHRIESLEEEQVCNTLFAGYLSEDVDKKEMLVWDLEVKLD